MISAWPNLGDTKDVSGKGSFCLVLIVSKNKMLCGDLKNASARKKINVYNKLFCYQKLVFRWN